MWFRAVVCEVSNLVAVVAFASLRLCLLQVYIHGSDGIRCLWVDHDVMASHLRMEGREFSSNTVGIPRTEQHWWADGRGAPAIWFSSNEVWTRLANFAGGRMLNGTEHSNQGPSQTLNGMEHSVPGIQGLNLSSELNFSITTQQAHKI